jgi:hypothetical protein
MIQKREWRWAASVALVLVAVSCLPYVIAWVATPAGSHFTGLVFNPLDGQSYMAKMRQGLEGSWTFHLAFTPERHRGAYVFLFHLLLGHVARWTGLPLIVIYHIARLLGGTAMLLALYGFAAQVSGAGARLPESALGERRAMFLLAAVGAGLGWLTGLGGLLTSDLWVPEAFPAYALLANAHFPLSIGLMVAVASCGLRLVEGSPAPGGGTRPGWRMGLAMAAAALALGVIQPFGLVPVFGGLGVMLAARSVREGAVPWRALVWTVGIAVLALPYPLYMQWALHADPVLAAWNAQNVTTSPPLWDWALSYGLVLVLAVPGAAVAVRRGRDEDWLLAGWVVVTLAGMYVPLPLQRRLSLGLGVPLGILAGMGWWRVVRQRVRAPRRGLLQGLVVGLSAMTPVFLVLTSSLGALAGHPLLYLSEGEWAAMAWLREHAPSDAVVLCAPETGMFVPAWAGQRVVYGHPFETVDAGERQAEVERFWAGERDPAWLEALGVDYFLYGPREHVLGGPPSGERLFEAGDTAVFRR